MFTFWRSLASLRVRIALNLKGIETERTFVDLDKGEQFAPDFLAVNPQAALPALVVDDGPALVQSLAILEWLEEVHPLPPMLPGDPLGRCRVRALAFTAADGHALIVPRVRKKIAEDFGVDEEGKRSWVRYWLGRQLAGLETQLARDSATGLFAHGDAITMADIAIYSIHTGYRLHDGADAYPTIDGIVARCNEHPAFAAAQPLAQPDAPKRAA